MPKKKKIVPMAPKCVKKNESLFAKGVDIEAATNFKDITSHVPGFIPEVVVVPPLIIEFTPKEIILQKVERRLELIGIAKIWQTKKSIWFAISLLCLIFSAFLLCYAYGQTILFKDNDIGNKIPFIVVASFTIVPIIIWFRYTFIPCGQERIDRREVREFRKETKEMVAKRNRWHHGIDEEEHADKVAQDLAADLAWEEKRKKGREMIGGKTVIVS
jgi:hypothetical protein